MDKIIDTAGTIALAIVGLAIVAVLVSRNANTTGVIQSAASGFNNAIGVASAPVTGAAVNLNLSYPNALPGFSPSFAAVPTFG